MAEMREESGKGLLDQIQHYWHVVLRWKWTILFLLFVVRGDLSLDLHEFLNFDRYRCAGLDRNAWPVLCDRRDKESVNADQQNEWLVSDHYHQQEINCQHTDENLIIACPKIPYALAGRMQTHLSLSCCSLDPGVELL